MRNLWVIEPRTPPQFLQVVYHRTEDLDLVCRVKYLGRVVSHVGSGHVVSSVGSKLIVGSIGGCGGAPLPAILHQKPSSLLYVVWTNGRPVGRRHGSPVGAHRVAQSHSVTGHHKGTFVGRCCNHF